MKNFAKFGAAAAVGGVALLLSATAASAYTVCNDKGDCWRSATKYDDPIHVTYYDDDWDWKAHNYRWHEVDESAPGYWDSDTNRWVVTKKTTTTTTTTETTPQ